MGKMKNRVINVSFDGGCGPYNPGGKMTYAAIISLYNNEKVRLRGSKGSARENSNNVAEYLGLLLALDWLIEHQCCNATIEIKGDSQLVIKQMQGRWRVKRGRYKDYALNARTKIKQFSDLALIWVPREYNGAADAYARNGS